MDSAGDVVFRKTFQERRFGSVLLFANMFKEGRLSEKVAYSMVFELYEAGLSGAMRYFSHQLDGRVYLVFDVNLAGWQVTPLLTSEFASLFPLPWHWFLAQNRFPFSEDGRFDFLFGDPDPMSPLPLLDIVFECALGTLSTNPLESQCPLLQLYHRFQDGTTKRAV